MTNADIFKKLLKPVKPADNPFWENFLKTLREDVLWTPNSRGLFEDLGFWYSGLNPEITKPSLHIHTSPFPNANFFELLEDREQVHESGFRIHPLERMELEFRDLDYRDEVQYECLNNGQAIGVSYFLGQEEEIARFRQVEGERDESLNDLRRMARILKGRSIDQMIEEMDRIPAYKMTGRLLLMKIRFEKMQVNDETYLLLAFIQDTVFQKVFIKEGGLKVGAIV